MPINSTGRKIISDLIKGVMTYEEDTATNFNYETIAVGGGAGNIEPIGIPVIWDNADTRFEVFVAQDIPTVKGTGGSPLPGGSVIALLVGDALGKGNNQADIDISSDVKATALYRGDATIVNEGIDWGAASAPQQAAFLAELELNRITTIANAEVVTPTYNEGL